MDPACGSGSFLIGAYQYLLQYHKDYYTANPKPGRSKDNPLTPEGALTTAEKKRILLNNIFGVDLDANAVEVTKLSLLLKCMEGETEASIATQMLLFHDRILPTLDGNIKSGNSLIDVDYYDQVLDFGEDRKIKPFSWKKAFPEVFKQGGFDAVIGNPPYVMTEISKEQKNYFSKKFILQKGKPDLYRYFFEKSFELLKDKSYFSFIIPNSILTIPACKTLRKFLLQAGGITEVVNFWGEVFYQVSINSTIVTAQKGSKNDFLTVIDDVAQTPSQTSLQESAMKAISIKKSELLSTEGYELKAFGEKSSELLIQKILEMKATEPVCKYTLGMQVYHNTVQSQDEIKCRIYHSENRKNKTYLPESGGSNIKRYYFDPTIKEYVSYGEWCYNRPDWEFCEGERILIREIPDNGLLRCCLTDTLSVSNKSVVILKGLRLSNKYLLGLLNSRLIGYYAFNSTEKGQQRLFPRVSLKTIKNLPLKDIDEGNKEEVNTYNKITRLVDELLKLNEEKQKTSLPGKLDQIQNRIDYCEERINEIVYQLYGLTEEEIALVAT